MKSRAARWCAPVIIPIAAIVSIALVSIALVSSVRCTQPPPYQPVAWQTGQWVEYTVSTGNPALAAHTVRLRYSLTGDHTEDAIRYFWFETSGALDTTRFIFRVLAPDRQLNQTRRVIIKIGGETAQEMPRELAEAPVEYQLPFFDPALVARAKPKSERLKTAAGAFRCIHARIGGADVWLSSEVPVTGIVRYRSSDQYYELTGSGRSGAVSGITELPELIDLDKIFPPSDSAKK